MPRPFPLIALCCLTLLGCSKVWLTPQMPLPEANLAAPCSPLPSPPTLDPERAMWETSVVLFYRDCAGKHWMTIEAWRKLAKEQRK